jgi:hypothetical protein
VRSASGSSGAATVGVSPESSRDDATESNLGGTQGGPSTGTAPNAESHAPLDLSDVPAPLASELKDSTIGEIPRRIVGVVDDIRMSGLQRLFWPVVYTEYRQQDKGLWYGCLEPKFIIRSRPAGAVPLPGLCGVR